MVQHMRRMREAGELGEILIAQGTYSQDWLLYDTDWNWRVDRESGRSAARDGRHRLALVRHGRTRHRAADHVALRGSCNVSQDAQAAAATCGHVRRPITDGPMTMSTYAVVDTEDFAAVLFHLGDRARGAFTVSQVSAGCKNRLTIEIYGTRASAAWNQERPDELWIGRRDRPQRDDDQRPRAAGAWRGGLRRSAGRPQRRVRRHVQAAVSSVLPVDCRCRRQRPSIRNSSMASGRCGCLTRRLPATSGAAGWMLRPIDHVRRLWNHVTCHGWAGELKWTTADVVARCSS